MATQIGSILSRVGGPDTRYATCQFIPFNPFLAVAWLYRVLPHKVFLPDGYIVSFMDGEDRSGNPSLIFIGLFDVYVAGDPGLPSGDSPWNRMEHRTTPACVALTHHHEPSGAHCENAAANNPQGSLIAHVSSTGCRFWVTHAATKPHLMLQGDDPRFEVTRP